MNSRKNQNKKRDQQRSEIICRCNEVSKDTILQAIHDGARTLNEIFDLTTAGVGPCGGSCRKTMGPLLEEELKKLAALKSPPDDSSK